MISRNPLIPCLLLVLICLVVPVKAAETGRLHSVIDGDSLEVVIEGKVVEVRLIGIDAPEWGQEYGLAAKSFVLHFCLGKELKLEYDKDRRDRYRRSLAYVYVGGKMLNEAIVREGLALAFAYKPNTRHQARLFQAQADARDAEQGFWQQGGLELTPSQWRKKNRR
ncbi:Nuclease (SNase domain protein) (Modular protein) [Pseudodesulfovibrio profundus]|uniref:Nuclease (SNase domain protein) (Modular protein) n=1 Tax=Pseudodesulfovibrio profundus TaxID=57320 RepID=A0A2C8FB12_9BACT|nr:thermonuclease family protein [Pseudodesulfovibrio profundus]SOB59076.1 Nuclease (SNase domain protein) (Modular protein) [Pseudodesulfovibrio profundus]